MKLKYGMNPYQDYAEVIDKSNALELKNGNPSVINVLDALNSWQLVKETSLTLQTEASTSFKHVTPSGVAISKALDEKEKQAYLIKQELSDLASSYARARGTDRLASFGDFIAVSHPVDKQTALLIKSEVSDGIVAPGYSKEALEILSAKKKGGYVVFQIDSSYEPEEIESREVFGITIKQKRNNLRVSDEMFSNVVTSNKELIPQILTDLKLGMITLKYTQSNSICVVNNGHVIGIGSGQQSRILCSNLALTKANVWYQKMLLDYSFLKEYSDLKRTDLDQIIEQKRQETFGNEILLNQLPGTCMLSDGFFPQKDNIELAHQYGIKYIATPMGSVRDKEIVETADKLGITLINTGVRLFHH
ncbi:5-aminoimidazole-4-carboxamide ribonucleotide transformylase [Microbacter margulisiae]|uniref:Phosphoribosylaminoimidazolecarboxamide formyltransferase/IMP cyclohydrolase n=1 Tax=Microbacter margulisiae TaxID=1350067 RepID=A0A7W5DQ24_9PORP|nr:5-aminoimidazole-4-carboxamide ribonucleotide transformylase [Microbacter margulisiae]MBB3186892.1 phosphoribosylaminoimidazolecarboxamide formyltransferase/IMP cyclohydrolase [Microbacter margulisiae]